MAACAVDLQLCGMCCSCGPGCSSSSSAFSAVGLPRVVLRKSRGKKQKVIRSLYSTLVENFGTTQSTYSPDWTSNSFRTRDDETATPSSRGQEQPWDEVSEEGGQHCSRDPQASAIGNAGFAEKRADTGFDNIDMKRSARARPPSMSISQGFSSHVRHSMSHSVGAVGHPMNLVKLPGPMGLMMAIAVAALGLKTAVAKQGSPQKICGKCEGYGLQQCHVCQGRGVLNWEGKLRRTDPCPLCFGSCLKKCSTCGGVKIKKGMPPAMASKLQLRM